MLPIARSYGWRLPSRNEARGNIFFFRSPNATNTQLVKFPCEPCRPCARSWSRCGNRASFPPTMDYGSGGCAIWLGFFAWFFRETLFGLYLFGSQSMSRSLASFWGSRVLIFPSRYTPSDIDFDGIAAEKFATFCHTDFPA